MHLLRLTLVACVFLFGSAAAPAENAEIQMFVNYRGLGHYEEKLVSTLEMPVSAFFVYVPQDAEPSTAACFRGESASALQVFRAMVEMFNLEYHHRIHVIGTSVVDPLTGAEGLRIDAEEAGQSFNWFQNMGRCRKHSKSIERHPTS